MTSSFITSWITEGEKMDVVIDLLFLGSKITAGFNCSREIRRQLLLRRKAVTNLDSVVKSRDINLPTKVHIVQSMDFPVITYGYERWAVKKAECQSIDVFKLLLLFSELLFSCCVDRPQHARHPHSSPSPRAFSNSCPLSQ